MSGLHCAGFGGSRVAPALRITVVSRLSGAVAVVGLSALSLVGCAAHATTSPPARPAAGRPSSPKPVASAVAAPAASPTPCPSESGWTGENLSTAAPDPAAWLTAAQMPDAAVYDWTPQGTATAQPFAEGLWNALYGVGASDFLAWQEQPYQGSSNGDSASQTIFLYATEAQANCAYQGALAGSAANQAQSRAVQTQQGIAPDAVTTETVSGADDSAWTESWTAPSIPEVAHGPQTDVVYMAQVGTALTFVICFLPGLNESTPDAAAAQATLSAMTQDLNVYATGS
jgi:hypothetical protein